MTTTALHDGVPRPRGRGSRAWLLGVSSAVAAVLTWLTQALAGRVLGPAGYAEFMVVWGLVFLVVGMQLGLQQVVTQAVVQTPPPDDSRTSTSPLVVGAAVGGVGALAILGSSPWWGSRVFGDDWWRVVLACAAGFAAYGAYNAVNGVLAGLDRWPDYATSMATEAVLRLVLVAGAVGASLALPGQALALVGAAGAWVLLLGRRGIREAVGRRVVVSRADLSRAAAQAMIATTCSAILVAGFPVLLSVSTPGDLPPEAGVLLAAVVATRAPLMLPLTAFQAVLLAMLARSPERARSTVVRLILLLVAVTLTGALLGALTGPTLLRVLYGPGFDLDAVTTGLLVVGAGLLAVQTVIGIATLAVGLHRVFALGWSTAAVACVLVLQIPGPIAQRTVAALLAAPLSGAVVHLVGLTQARRSRARPRRRRASRRRFPARILVPLAVFVLLTVLGVSQSSIGIDALREQPAEPHGVMLGEARQIRSDEFLTSGPTFLGVMATGTTDTLNPLAAQQGMFSGLPRGVVSTLVLPDSAVLTLGPWLPDAMLFAAKWWLPFLLLALAAPAWFRRVSGSASVGWWAATLIALSPSSAWWSFIQVQVLGFALAAVVALQCAVEDARTGRWWRAALWGSASSLLLVRTALTYQPWVVVLVPPLLLATVLGVWSAPERRGAGRMAVVLVGVGSALALAAVVLENRSELSTIASTIYPGQRRVSGGPGPVQDLFAATALGPLQDAPELLGSNYSEISSSFAALLAWVAVLLAAGTTSARRVDRAVVGVFVVVTGFWFAWSTISFGTWGAHVPLANMVPTQRSAEVLGYLAIVTVCLLLPRLHDRPRRAAAWVSAVSVAAIAANAGSVLRETNLPSLSLVTVWVSSLLLGAVVLVITLAPRRPWGYVAGAIAALALVVGVNPVLVGTADLRGSDTAQLMLAAGDRARAAGTSYASDTYAVDALLLATGVPAVSGRQVSGPDAAAWRTFVPEVPEQRWNRGAAFIWFQWTSEERIRVTNPGDDIILLSGSPCAVARRLPELGHVVSSRELDEPCLSQEQVLTWGGSLQWVYVVR